MSVHLAHFSDYLPNFVFYSPPSPSSAAGTSSHDVGDPLLSTFPKYTTSRTRPPQNMFWFNTFLLVFLTLLAFSFVGIPTNVLCVFFYKESIGRGPGVVRML